MNIQELLGKKIRYKYCWFEDEGTVISSGSCNLIATAESDGWFFKERHKLSASVPNIEEFYGKRVHYATLSGIKEIFLEGKWEKYETN